MEIDKTFEAKIVKTSLKTEGINIPPQTRHHFKIDTGDTVVFEIKQIIKRMPLPLISHGTSNSFITESIERIYDFRGERTTCPVKNSWP